MLILYDVILWILLPFILVYHIYRSFSRERPAALPQRFGFVGTDVTDKLEGRRPIWVHAVSVGETVAVKPLLSALKKSYPQHPLVISNMTETGRSIALNIADADACIYFPFDFAFAVNRLFSGLKPVLVVIVETELWPNFLRSACSRSIPVVIVNGRISDRSFRSYFRFRRFFGRVLQYVGAFCMQSDDDANRIISIGAPSDKVSVTRNLKYDVPFTRIDLEEKKRTRQRFGIPENGFVFTAGSTHKGEDEYVLSAYDSLRKSGDDAFLVLVPRHPERAGEVSAVSEKYGLKPVLFSSLPNHGSLFEKDEILVVDTVGVLLKLYAVSDLVFVGGSLVPVGGHNPLEPASCGVPVIFGPHMTNFREIAALAVAYGAAREVRDPEALKMSVLDLYNNQEERLGMGEGGGRLLSAQAGSTGLNMVIIDRILKGVQ
ncbi:MAG TPA: 3-deoxy-D-manno-octulosonic acid transferase [Geobacteraceae bacterium]|nr:3-deoxy-D-manno-octulosonic acid transferase [Geobacteraceae bacterium]